MTWDKVLTFDGETQMLGTIRDGCPIEPPVPTIEQDIMDGKFRALPGHEPTLMINGEAVDFAAIGEALGAVSR